MTSNHFTFINEADKYLTQNPLARLLINNFLSKFQKLLVKVSPQPKILEIGSGEGFMSNFIVKNNPSSKIVLSDISQAAIKALKKNFDSYKNVQVQKANAERLPFSSNNFDLVVCCEVLEHLKDPQRGFQELSRVTNFAILSVPNEPLWSILNLLRGHYFSRLGNTPSHLQKWSPKSFIKLAGEFHLKAIDVLTPLPWTLVLTRKQS